MLLIIENNDSICQYFPSEAKFLNVGSMSLTEVLVELKDHLDATHIYLPIELKFKGTYRQALQGLELFKHIRLTTELGKLHLAPVLLGYTYPLENILRNPESTILCSPATHLFNLKKIHQVKSSLFLKSEETITKEILKRYILFTDNDKGKSEHDRRNEQGPLKLERELNGTSNSDIGLDLWQKKLLFLQTEVKANEQTNVSDADFKATIKGKRILYLDDEADKWEKPLKKLFEGATLDIKKDYEKIAIYFDNLRKEQDKFRFEYAEIDRILLQIFSNSSKKSEVDQKRSEANKIKSKLAELLNYDLVLLDMRLNKDADKGKPIDQLSGIEILNKIQEINPFIPVVMFTASDKVESYKEVVRRGAYDFWVKNVSSANDLKKTTLALLRNDLQGKQLGNLKYVYARFLMIKSRIAIWNYSPNTKNPKKNPPTEIIAESFSDIDRERINDSVCHFVNFIQRLMTGNVTDFDIEELWKMTGETIQIRVPAIYGLYEPFVKRIDKKHNISDKEFDFRWNRNFFSHSELDDETRNKTLDPYDRNRSIDYINHTIEFLLDYR